MEEKLQKVVTDFQSAMNERFEACSGRKTGWDDPPPTNEDLKDWLLKNIYQGDWVDVANLAALLWYRDGYYTG